MITSDDFSGATLDPRWQFEGPSGAAGVAVGGGEAFLELSVGAGGDYSAWDDNGASRLLQSITDADFTVEARFLTTPSQRYQAQGLLVQQDAANTIRFDTFSNGNALFLFAAVTVDGVSSSRIYSAVTPGEAEFLRVSRAGDVWTFEHSADGATWLTAGSFAHALTVTAVGPFAESTADNPGAGPGYTAQVDYVFNTAAPIVPEDAGISPDPGNTAPVAQDDALTTAQDTDRTITVASELLDNDSDADGDTLTLASFTQPTNGSLTDLGNGTLTYAPNPGYAGADAFTYTITDGNGGSDTATVDVTVLSPGAGNDGRIDVWYGTEQTFGQLGEPQAWINILGDVDPTGLVSFGYTLNGGPERALAIGPDTRRLQEAGDFNADIAFAELNGSVADDIVTLRAVYDDGDVVTETVTVSYEAGHLWPHDYSIDWASVTDLQDVVQVVDGAWSFDADSVGVDAIAYDRLLAIGDRTWDNYEVNLQVEMIDLTSNDPNGRDGGGWGFHMLWNGHSDVPVAGFQPKAGWEGVGSFWYDSGGILIERYKGAGLIANDSLTLLEGATYNFTVRVEQTNVFDRAYRWKIWEVGTTEPSEWTQEAVETFSEPVTGSFLLNAHYNDVRFGDITVTEIEGNDILTGTDGSDTLAGVDVAAATPGSGEVDVMIGGAGADLFLFGDGESIFYDDGLAGAGEDDYAYVWDFDAAEDTLQLHGASDDYVLAAAPSAIASGTAVYLADGQSGSDELIAVLDSVFDLTLDGAAFRYVDDALV